MGEKFDPDAAQERLDELGDDIERTREATDERDPLGDGERSFADTDDPPQENDQGVAPPA